MRWYKWIGAAVLLVCVAFLIYAFWPDAQYVPPKEGPDLSESTAFRIHAVSTVRHFGQDGKLKRRKTGKGAETVFAIKDEGRTGKAEMVGSEGVGTVEFMRTHRSLVIMESPPLGSTHYWIIYDNWSFADEGFRCVYVRHIPALIGEESVVTIGIGVAKPLIHQD